MKHEHSFNPQTNSTFQFNPSTGQIVNKINVGDKKKIFIPQVERYDEESAGIISEFHHLIEDAEMIKEYPDTKMFFDVDESDYD